jgi:hypothetical protein
MSYWVGWVDLLDLFGPFSYPFPLLLYYGVPLGDLPFSSILDLARIIEHAFSMSWPTSELASLDSCKLVVEVEVYRRDVCFHLECLDWSRRKAPATAVGICFECLKALLPYLGHYYLGSSLGNVKLLLHTPSRA